jgi:predicted GIY-YIG superfamily endonuclease
MYSVYVFLDQKNRPYYVGKTNNMKRRRKEHLYEIDTGNTLPKYAKARKLIDQGFYLKMRRIRKTYSEDKAFALERKYIKKYRKMGYVLMNCTYGGPDEKPMKINNMKNPNPKGIRLSGTKTKKKGKRIVKKIKRLKRS